MTNPPTPREYSRLVLQVRRAGGALMRKEADRTAELRARAEERQELLAALDPTGTIARACELVPEIIARFGDTPALQATRRAAIQ